MPIGAIRPQMAQAPSIDKWAAKGRLVLEGERLMVKGGGLKVEGGGLKVEGGGLRVEGGGLMVFLLLLVVSEALFEEADVFCDILVVRPKSVEGLAGAWVEEQV